MVLPRGSAAVGIVLKAGRLYGMRFEIRRQAMDGVIDWLTTTAAETAFDTGIHQSNEVRAKLACGTVTKDHIISPLRCADYQSKVTPKFC